jgi:hypothetical protein
VSSDRYLTAVGLSDEAIAHLRLLLRRPRPSVRQRWHWGTEDNADLIIVDAESYTGRMARDRAASGGRRCAVFNEKQDLRANELSVEVPLNAESLFELLNQAAKRTENSGELVAARSDEFDEIAAEFEHYADSVAEVLHAPSENVAPSLEELLLRNKDTELFANRTLQVKAGVTTEGAERISPRSMARAPFGPTGGDAGSDKSTSSKPDPAPGDLHWLEFYLQSELLRAPVAMALSGAPQLVLDPKRRVFLSKATHLQELIEYCTHPLLASEWRTLTTPELQQLRSLHRERPYAHLTWLRTWLHSEGRLAAHLPPSASFRLLVWPDIDDAAESHRRIAEALMRPGKLHEIAARSGTEQSDVIDLINAYDAIGLIDAERASPRAQNPSAKTRLLTRLRHTFRRRP